MKLTLTATLAAAWLALCASPVSANEWKMAPLNSQVSILPEARDLQETDRREYLCLALAIFHEARGEPEKGMRAVAHVVFNRRESGKFPKSICGVVWQRGQFSWTTKPVGAILPHDRKSWEIAQEIAQRVIGGNSSDPTGGATYFYNRRLRAPAWTFKATSRWIFGNHVYVGM